MSARSGSGLLTMTPALLAAAGLGVVMLTTARKVETHPRITTTLLWNKDIAPILQRRCFSCHSPQNVSMPLVTYAEARPWAAAIREEVLLRQMPPWSAVAGYGRVQKDPSLTQGEWDLLVAWADGGAPSGQSLAEEQQPAVFASTSASWEHGTPDVVLASAAAHDVPANAPDMVHRFTVTTPFKAEQRVHGLSFKPGDRRVVRYASVYEAGSQRWLFTWTPWATSMHLPEGSAYVLPAGATLSVEVGYRGTDEAATDTSEVGLYLDQARGSATATVQPLEAAALDLAAGAVPTRTRGEVTLDVNTAIHAVWAEVGPGTTSVELTAYVPGGAVRPLLWLRDYRSDWPSPYVYTDPVPLPRGTRLVMTAYVANPGAAAVKSQPRLHLVRVPAPAATF